MNIILPFPRDEVAQDQAGNGPTMRHPISQWYVCPLVEVIASRLVPTRIRPSHVTLAGVVLLGCAAWTVAAGYPLWGSLLVWLAWCCDRLDGALARAQQTATRFGAWLDANIDELGDIVLHGACAACAATIFSAIWPWWLFLTFIGGKYLWQYGIRLENEIAQASTAGAESPEQAVNSGAAESTRAGSAWVCVLRRLYNLPGNADLRVHFLIAMLAIGRPEYELMFVAGYFGLRAAVRGVIVFRRFQRGEEVSVAPKDATASATAASASKESA